MWVRTRDPRRRGPNQEILRQDAARLAEWGEWLRRAVADPDRIRDASPVAGAWHFRCRIHNFAPALQQVALERRGPDGSWETLHARFTLEFRAFAARRRSRLCRAFNVPIDSPADRLRLAIRGIGQVAVGAIELTDGVHRLAAKGRRKKILGRPARTRGWPDLDLTKNRAVWNLRF